MVNAAASPWSISPAPRRPQGSETTAPRLLSGLGACEPVIYASDLPGAGAKERLVQRLLGCWERGEKPSVEEVVTWNDLRTVAGEVGLPERPRWKALPWLLRLERVVFGYWQPLEDNTIRCPECGSTHVVRKSRTPRLKKFYDEAGQVQEVAVYRYYCRNKDCSRGSFTHLPAGLVPYSRHRLEVHLLALQAYEWSYSTYRRTGQALRVSEMTVYRWVSAWGQQLLPVAALFGLIRSSGVVGVDEKYVLVPKNDKPAGKSFGSVITQPNASYARGSIASAQFWGGHPNNNLRTQDTFLVVEKLVNGKYVPVARDWDPETTYRWQRNGISYSKITITWHTKNADAGTYRILHRGNWKSGWTGKIGAYEGVSRIFKVL